ncbi:MAG TPA: wax ester/triacylglycerol synthase domain-containing protein, partial [Mycobacterium sp.]|nr:wax ester/triacylglycerol synthase domain-containing protein [Mycobacterium sp.]
MNPLDTAMITGEVLFHPLNIGAVLILAPPRDAGQPFIDQLYRDAVTSTAPIEPCLRLRPHRGRDTGGLWTWRTDDTVDLESHLHRRTLPPGNGRDELWRLVGDLHGRPLDRSRPLWVAYLIDGLPDGRLAFYVKVHHIVVDGVAGLQMIT